MKFDALYLMQVLEIIGFPMVESAFVLKKPFTKEEMVEYDGLIEQMTRELAMKMLSARFTPELGREVDFRKAQREHLKVNLYFN